MSRLAEQPPIVHAPPRPVVVRRLAAMGAAALLLAIAGRYLLVPRVRAYLDGATRADALDRVENVLFPLAAAVLLGAAYSIALGVRVLRAGQWPLPGAFVVRDTPVVRGAAARLRAWAWIVAGLLLAGLAGWTAWLPRALFGAGTP